jgi:hypothetical protein
METSPAGSDAMNKCKRLDSDSWKVTVYRSVEGGGTGQEFPDNLKQDIDSPGNKWYDCWSNETWIKGTFTEPRRVRKIVLQSANDTPDRDPYTIVFYKYNTDDKENNYLVKYDHVIFQERYLKKEFVVDSVEKVDAIVIVIEANKSYYENGNWGSGTQLAQVIFYYDE